MTHIVYSFTNFIRIAISLFIFFSFTEFI
uniref:Uncharacterized protein n=1 Tax=Rhizophora mucronata TaxID=61149 RepID=A0A2P2PHY2_RHIMU